MATTSNLSQQVCQFQWTVPVPTRWTTVQSGNLVSPCHDSSDLFLTALQTLIVPLWWDPNDVPHRRTLPFTKLHGGRVVYLSWCDCYCQVDQLWILIANLADSTVVQLHGIDQVCCDTYYTAVCVCVCVLNAGCIRSTWLASMSTVRHLVTRTRTGRHGSRSVGPGAITDDVTVSTPRDSDLFVCSVSLSACLLNIRITSSFQLIV